MTVGTAMVLIALGVFFYKKPAALKWVGGVVLVLVLGVSVFVYQSQHTSNASDPNGPWLDYQK